MMKSVLALVALSACAAEVEEVETSTAAEEIIGGTVATAYPEAVMLDMTDGGYCSGVLVAPKLVLTAAHCVLGFYGWDVRSPTTNQTVHSTAGGWYDWTNPPSVGTSDPNHHDIGFVILQSPIYLASYPTIASAPVAENAQAVSVGRIDNAAISFSSLFASPPVALKNATPIGYPYDYYANLVIQHGDSGGPTFAVGTHKIVGVNSAGGTTKGYYARTDLLYGWIQQMITDFGGTNTPPPSSTCIHNLCTTGGALSASCDSCAAQICAFDAYCCNNSWDSACVDEVQSICNQNTCTTGQPAPTCAHSVCTAGAKLAASCDSCAAKICAADAFCCTGNWDGQCVAEVATVCHQTCE